MSPLTSSRRWRVFLHEWDVYDTIINAGSADEALSLAQDLYARTDKDHFSHHDGGVEGMTAEEMVS